MTKNVWIPITISLKFVPYGPIYNIPALVPIMAWRRLGDKPLSEPMMFGLRPQWVNEKVKSLYLWPLFRQSTGNGYGLLCFLYHISARQLRIELTYQLSKFSFSRNFHVLLSWYYFWLLSNHQNWFLCDFVNKWHFFLIFFSYHIFAIYVGGASLGLPTACRLIAVSGARLPSVDGLVVRCIKMHHHVKSVITIYLQFI